AGARRPPEDHGDRAGRAGAAVREPAQRRPGREQVILADDLVEGARPHADGERRRPRRGRAGRPRGAVLLARPGRRREQVAHPWEAIPVLPALGRLIARRPLRFVAAWVVLVVLGFSASSGAFGEGLFDRLQAGDEPQVASEARTGQRVLNDSSPGGGTETLLLDHVDPADPTVRRAVEQVASRLDTDPDVLGVRSPY